MSFHNIFVWTYQHSKQILLAWLVVYLLIELWNSEYLKKIFLIASSIMYAVLFLGMTLLGREAGEEMRYKLELLWEYRRAFQFEAGKLKIQDIEYAWYIRDNIILGIPLGVLLGGLFQKRRKHRFPCILLTGCMVSVLVESCQLVFRIGLFELDDILNNTIGALLGFCFYMLVKKLIQNIRYRSKS